MSMTETPAATPQVPNKRKYAARRKRRVAAAPKPSEFAGLTAANCYAACSVNGCVISGKPYCAHPYKGGLQGADMGNAAAVERLNAAKKSLGKKKIKLGEVP